MLVVTCWKLSGWMCFFLCNLVYVTMTALTQFNTSLSTRTSCSSVTKCTHLNSKGGHFVVNKSG